jgi:hypothetical protein
MTRKDKIVRDPFNLSLGGMSVVSGYAAAPAISHERLRKSRNDRPDGSKAGRGALRGFLAFRTST